jgi:flavodoxin
MAKILVVYYSSYGHIEQMAHAVAEGARFQGRHVAEIAGRLEHGAGERGPVPPEMNNPTETTGGTSGQP